ncbi:MAG: hypothetical protein FRX49_11693 [Trebouxia sp. A1-2]|nr:MAG: hypothetical protein FRX49_11693 [Trebouxia sp. A1-2]
MLSLKQAARTQKQAIAYTLSQKCKEVMTQTFLDEVLVPESSCPDNDSRLVLRLGTRDTSLLMRGEPEA